MHKQIELFKPSVVVIDPVTTLTSAGVARDVRSMMLRLIDSMKTMQITAYMLHLIHGSGGVDESEVEVSSLIDTWLYVREIESGGERNRGLYVLKSRGMAHSNQVREFKLGKQGVELLDVYMGPSGALVGRARLLQEAKEKAAIKSGRLHAARQPPEQQAPRRPLRGRVHERPPRVKNHLRRPEPLRTDSQGSGSFQRRAEGRARNADARTSAKKRRVGRR
jgi:circadian clock protein KaiC